MSTHQALVEIAEDWSVPKQLKRAVAWLWAGDQRGPNVWGLIINTNINFNRISLDLMGC